MCALQCMVLASLLYKLEWKAAPLAIKNMNELVCRRAHKKLSCLRF